MFKMAKRNNIPLPYASVEDIKEAYKFGSLGAFLDLYYLGTYVFHSSPVSLVALVRRVSFEERCIEGFVNPDFNFSQVREFSVLRKIFTS